MLDTFCQLLSTVIHCAGRCINLKEEFKLSSQSRGVSSARYSLDSAGRGMAKDWRISTFNGVLLASYFIPSWTMSAMKIWVSPIRGLYDRSNIGPAMYVSDFMTLSALGTTRFAWILALGKVMVAAFFMVFFAVDHSRSHPQEGQQRRGARLRAGLGCIHQYGEPDRGIKSWRAGRASSARQRGVVVARRHSFVGHRQ